MLVCNNNSLCIMQIKKGRILHIENGRLNYVAPCGDTTRLMGRRVCKKSVNFDQQAEYQNLRGKTRLMNERYLVQVRFIKM